MNENIGGTEIQFIERSIQDWITRWDQNRINGFHKEHVHPLLERNVIQLINGRENLRIFLPLCGKSVDIKWLADHGHTVCGVEVAEKALCEFFKEQNISYTTEPVPCVSGTMFKSDNPQLQLFCCDVYNFSEDVIGQFDAIWDRGALVAVNRSDRIRYTSLMKSLMAPGCRYLLCVADLDESIIREPPHKVSDDQVQTLFGDVCNVKKIDRHDAFEEKHRSWGINSFYENLFLITLKGH